MDVIDAIKSRRSINFFEPESPLSEEKIRELIEIANLAPSSFNLQPWKVVVVRTPQRKKALRECAMNQAKVTEAPAVLIMVADIQGLEQNEKKVLDSWQDLGYMKPEMRSTYSDMMKSLYGEKDSIRRKFFAVKNTALFSMNLMLAAKGLGLETHPMDGFDEECIKKEFHLPESSIIPMIIAVGALKKGTTLLPRAVRRNLSDFTTFE